MSAFDHSITEVVTSTGRKVACSYLGNPNYDPTSNVCACLHWLFLLYSPARNPARAYLLRDAISLFVDFAHLHNSNNPEPLHIKMYTDINAEVFNRYIEYVYDLGDTPAKPEIFKSAVKLVAEETGKLPLLTLPIVPMPPKMGKNPPLSPEGLYSLEEALSTHVNLLWDKMVFREEVENVQPYTADEINDQVFPVRTRVRMLQSFHYQRVNDIKPNKQVWLKRLSECTDPELRELTLTPETAMQRLRAIYEREVKSLPAFDAGEDPLAGIPMSFWQPDYHRVIKTFLIHGYPFEMSLDYLYNELRRKNLNVYGVGCQDVIKLLLYRFTVANREEALFLPMVDEVLGFYYPTVVDMTAILLFMMFQSGWNKETALSLDKDNFEHLLTGTIDEAVKVVFAEKVRSQGNDKTYFDAKRIEIPTSGDDPYSFYNLILLARHMAAPLTRYPIDQIPVDMTEDQMNPLFLCLRLREDWSRGGRLTSIAHPKTFRVCVQHFLQQYEVVDNGKRLTSASELTRRLRPTWLLYKKRDNPIALLSMTMGHESRDTTDMFYDNSAAAHQERLQRLRSELEAIIELLRARRFKGMLSKHAQALAAAMWKVFHIPGQLKAMWGCADQTKPNWVGSEIIATTGKKCWKIKECIFCSQLRIFQDSLPYLMERDAHLSELLESGAGGFSSRFVKEQEAIRFILDEWGDYDEIKQAARYRRNNGPLLPRDLDLLEIIFESEVHNA
ncbi:hypothetical protein [Pseudomonas rubra]|uniref:Uncharacterized protein n=1 Tax=Pseudomonas rubra TaxID=2942627 RepID=A0ABT5PE62_9PSED|nr:hypothetical protein [Pseudomonas rubra]MDD1016605.1 hypothetical protein [Pseudomonas rubra]MDD1039402.1 hypothetical protein [Pseudomonas rubra]MDD1154847.1 hypothetical protein [Pseudomonas rubra]